MFTYHFICWPNCGIQCQSGVFAWIASFVFVLLKTAPYETLGVRSGKVFLSHSITLQLLRYTLSLRNIISAEWQACDRPNFDTGFPKHHRWSIWTSRRKVIGSVPVGSTRIFNRLYLSRCQSVNDLFIPFYALLHCNFTKSFFQDSRWLIPQ